MASSDWYIYVEGQQHGPLNEREMHHLVAYGRLDPGTLVWKPGFSTWMAAEAVEGLYKPPPPPPPPGAAVANGSGGANGAAPHQQTSDVVAANGHSHEPDPIDSQEEDEPDVALSADDHEEPEDVPAPTPIAPLAAFEEALLDTPINAPGVLEEAIPDPDPEAEGEPDLLLEASTPKAPADADVEAVVEPVTVAEQAQPEPPSEASEPQTDVVGQSPAPKLAEATPTEAETTEAPANVALPQRDTAEPQAQLESATEAAEQQQSSQSEADDLDPDESVDEEPAPSSETEPKPELGPNRTEELPAASAEPGPDESTAVADSEEEEDDLTAVATMLAATEQDQKASGGGEAPKEVAGPQDPAGLDARPSAEDRFATGLDRALDSYVQRHWMGDLGLAKSFWINSAALLGALAVVLSYTDRLAGHDHTLQPVIALGSLALFMPVLVWMGVGLWRSARKRSVGSGPKLWPRAAQAWVVLTFVVYAALSVSFANDKIAASRVAFATPTAEAPTSLQNDESARSLEKYAALLKRALAPTTETGKAVEPSETAAPASSAPAALSPKPEQPSAAAAPQTAPTQTAAIDPAPEPQPAAAPSPKPAESPAATTADPSRPIELVSYDKAASAAEETISIRNVSENPVQNISFLVTYLTARDELIYYRTLRMRGPIAPGKTATQSFPTPEGLRNYSSVKSDSEGPAILVRVEISAVEYQMATN